MSPPDRFPLATLPTPLVRATRLEQALDAPPIYLKRDDLTGFSVAGNKARKLEYLVADALARGCDTLLTGGGPGSNHCAATAAAARVAGLECRLVLYGAEPERTRTTLALARWFGAEVRFTGDPERASVDAGLAEERERLEAAGHRPYVIPRGGATPLGAVGYAHLVKELAGQLDAIGVDPEVVIVATGSCGTQAGLIAGTACGGHGWRVVGASVSRGLEECRERLRDLASGCADILGWPPPAADRIEVWDARGPGYGAPSPEGIEAARLAARTEGILLDPVFTAKAMAALCSLTAEGLRGPAVFIHTGGLPSALETIGGTRG